MGCLTVKLKQAVVIVNEFTTKTKRGGTRGGTPGAYVDRYMGRTSAVEDITPVRLMDEHEMLERYVARRHSALGATSKDEVLERVNAADGDGGIAFGTGSLSLSADAFHKLSDDIQQAFDDGKTVLKTVISFDPEYLKEMNCVTPGFELKRRGDYRSNVDQMKLRLAISEGMEALGRRRFDKLKWVGVIQVDTGHVHCHIAAVDEGVGVIQKTSRKQDGRLFDKDKNIFRRALNESLQVAQPVRMLASNVSLDRKNTRAVVRNFVVHELETRSIPQLLVAALPEDKQLWRAGSHARSMVRANEVCHGYVMGVLNTPGSGWTEAQYHVDQYASERQKNEGLSMESVRKLIRDGRDRIIKSCMDGVYSVLKKIPDIKKKIQTPFLNLAALSTPDAAVASEKSRSAEFVFRLRTYGSRIKKHRDELTHVHRLRKDFEAKPRSAVAAPMGIFYRIEEEYQLMCLSKYQNFLGFLNQDEEYDWDYELKQLNEKQAYISGLEGALADDAVYTMEPMRAEEYCKRVYGVAGGRFVRSGRLLERYDAERDSQRSMIDDVKVKMAKVGWTVGKEETHSNDFDPNDVRAGEGDRFVAQRKPAYSFDAVKAVDLHELSYDFPGDVKVSARSVAQFMRVARQRIIAYRRAVTYLERTGQADIIDDVLPKDDIERMVACMYDIGGSGILKSARPDYAKVRKTHTVSLDENIGPVMEASVTETVRTRLE